MVKKKVGICKIRIANFPGIAKPQSHKTFMKPLLLAQKHKHEQYIEKLSFEKGVVFLQTIMYNLDGSCKINDLS